MMEVAGKRPYEPAEGLTKAQNAALAKALAKDPAERFESCAALVDAFAKASTPAPVESPAGKPDRRLRMAMAAGVALLAALVVLAVLLATLKGCA